MKAVDHRFVDTWIVCHMGYRTREGMAQGIERLQDRLHRTYSDPTCRVLLRNWNDDIQALADRIQIWSPTTYPPKVALIGHSYGGFSCTLLAAELAKRGIEVDYMALIDAVWRFNRRATLLSLFSYHSITIPETVKRLIAWRQSVVKPSGHSLYVPDGIAYEIIESHVPHTVIDSDPGIQGRIESDLDAVLDL